MSAPENEGLMHQHLLDTSRAMVAAGQAGSTAKSIWWLGIADHHRRLAHRVAEQTA